MRVTRTTLATAAAALVLGFFPRSAVAVDGVVEINQTRVLAGGVTASDTPGFPVTLDASGSYSLTGSLDVSGEPRSQAATVTLSQNNTDNSWISDSSFEVTDAAAASITSLGSWTPLTATLMATILLIWAQTNLN